jgi:hypothetical protein
VHIEYQKKKRKKEKRKNESEDEKKCDEDEKLKRCPKGQEGQGLGSFGEMKSTEKEKKFGKRRDTQKDRQSEMKRNFGAISAHGANVIQFGGS